MWTITLPCYPWGRKGRIIKKKELKEYDEWKKTLDRYLIKQGTSLKEVYSPFSISIDNDYTVTQSTSLSTFGDITIDFSGTDEHK